MKYFFVEVPWDSGNNIEAFIRPVNKQIMDDSKIGWHFKQDGFTLNLKMVSHSRNSGSWKHFMGEKCVAENIYAVPEFFIPGYVKMVLVDKNKFLKYRRRIDAIERDTRKLIRKALQ